jgi:hypothetical protein
MLDFFGCGYVYVDNAKFDGYKFTISKYEETIIPSQISERVRDTFKKDISDDDSYNLKELFGEKSYRNDSDPNGRNNRNDNEK